MSLFRRIVNSNTILAPKVFNIYWNWISSQKWCSILSLISIDGFPLIIQEFLVIALAFSNIQLDFEKVFVCTERSKSECNKMIFNTFLFCFAFAQISETWNTCKDSFNDKNKKYGIINVNKVSYFSNWFEKKEKWTWSETIWHI